MPLFATDHSILVNCSGFIVTYGENSWLLSWIVNPVDYMTLLPHEILIPVKWL